MAGASLRQARQALAAAHQTVPEHISIVPASEASWDDLQAAFGSRGDPAACQCQFYKIVNAQCRLLPIAERAARLREETDCASRDRAPRQGLVAYYDGQPAGWCALEPRTAYPRLLSTRVPWTGRTEDRTMPGSRR